MQDAFERYRVKNPCGELVELRRLGDGRSICPVCGIVAESPPAWHCGEFDDAGRRVAETPPAPCADASGTCHHCHTRFGVDDDCRAHPGVKQREIWERLRIAWLDRIGWPQPDQFRLAATLAEDIPMLLARAGRANPALMASSFRNAVMQNDVRKASWWLERSRELAGEAELLDDAIVHGHVEMVRLLLQFGADPDQRASRSWRPVLAASMFRRHEIARVLCDAGAEELTDEERRRIDTGWRASRQSTTEAALLRAIREGDAEGVAAVLELQPELAEMDMGGDERPIHFAAELGRLEAVKLLIEHGADPDVETEETDCAWTIARTWGQHHVAQYLERLG